MKTYNCQTIKTGVKSIGVMFAAIFLSLAFSRQSAFAQMTIDPTVWQTGATGLKTQTDTEKRTGGLGFVVKQEDWPHVFLKGGVANAKSYNGPRLTGPTGIDLGQIKVPDTTGAFSSETTDWAHNEMIFNSGTASQLNLWVTRLSSAIAIQSQANTIRLFSGNVSGNQFYTNPYNQLDVRSTSAPAYPKYVAFPTASGITVHSLSTADTSLFSLSSNNNWLLVWYGSNSHFLDTKWPLTYNWTVPFTAGYQADTPILFVFENKPTSIKHSPEGGIDISFPSSSRYVTALPLFGREVLKASDTEDWSNGLPNNVVQKANWWANHLCSFPIRVSETYAYDNNTDKVTITENINFMNVCGGNSGTSFAPIPPILGIAKDAFNVAFSGNVVDGNLPTEFGPSLGIENPPVDEAGTHTYSWSVSGLKKYIDSQRILSTGQVPQELQDELNTQVQKIVDANNDGSIDSKDHFAPWIFMDAIPMWTVRGNLYWANPADIIYQLSETAYALPDGPTKTKLTNYIISERTNFSPEDKYDLELNLTKGAGVIRKDYSFYGWDWEYSWKVARTDAHLKRVPLYNFLALSRYYDLTGETLPPTVPQKAKDTLDRDMREQDWATMYWFKGFGDFYAHPEAVSNANRHFAGMVGYINLAKKQGDAPQAESLGRALFTKAAVLRLGLAKYPRYLYSANLVELPPEPDWMPNYAKDFVGHVYNFKWTGPYDDGRQVATLDQFNAYLDDTNAFWKGVPWTGRGFDQDFTSPHLFPFTDMVPELGRLLSDLAKADAEIYVSKVEALIPHWYAAFNEGVFGAEHNLNHPGDSFQIFMAKALIHKEDPDKLAAYSDVPWLEAGDLFYLHKLAETIKAYKGWSWSDQPLPTQGPTATPTPSCTLGTQGDINCDRKIDILDLVSILSNFGRLGSGISGDVNGDSKVDILDLVTLLGNFGKVS